MKKVFLFLLLLSLGLLMISCQENYFAYEFTVSFDSEGGTLIPDVMVANEEVISMPDSPTKENSYFLGWYLEDGTKNNFYEPVTSNKTLYAHWYTVENKQLSKTIEVDDAIFTVTITQDYLETRFDEVVVTVIMESKVSDNIAMYTGSYGEQGVVEFRFANIDLEDDYLYSELYMIPFTDDVLFVDLTPGKTITRTLAFATYPFCNSILEHYLEKLDGVYELEVSLYGVTDYIPTGLYVVVR